MLRAAAIGLAIALSLQAGQVRADSYDAGAGAFSVGNYSLAYDQWHAAAITGDVRAQKALAMLYDTGLGVPQSTYSAYVWFQIADLQPSVDLTQALAYLRTRLKPIEVERAEQLAYARSIEIRARRHAVAVTVPNGSEHRDIAALTAKPPVDLGSYTWFRCDCSYTDGSERYKAFDAAIGSALTF